MTSIVRRVPSRGRTGRGLLAMALGSALLVGGWVPGAGAATQAKITSVVTAGSTSAPVIVVNGHGFGSAPRPFPAFHPEGRFGCPGRPPTGNGFDYLSHLYLSDLHARHASFPVWTAGQSTRDLGILDCVGIVIASYTDTEVVFQFGNQYGTPHIAENVYFLSDGDPIVVVVNGARLRTTVHFPPG